MTAAVRGSSLPSQAVAWSNRSDISARSALVTILGDTIAPLGGTVWLTDLIGLAEPFGFNDRLVRTSMFRLAAEGWVTNERIGRRSRYSLTTSGRDQIADASRRIYRRSALPWDGQWTLVFLPVDPDDDLERHLRWHGLVQITHGVYAMPNADIEGARKLFDRLDVQPQPMVAVATFDAAGPAATAGRFRAASGLSRAEDAYRDFVDRYRSTSSPTTATLPPLDAFLLRTMVVHDLRRARLNDPELPADVLHHDWIGNQAMALAATIYHAVDEAAWQLVESVTGLAPNRSDPDLARRFADIPPLSGSKPPEVAP